MPFSAFFFFLLLSFFYCKMLNIIFHLCCVSMTHEMYQEKSHCHILGLLVFGGCWFGGCGAVAMVRSLETLSRCTYHPKIAKVTGSAKCWPDAFFFLKKKKRVLISSLGSWLRLSIHFAHFGPCSAAPYPNWNSKQTQLGAKANHISISTLFSNFWLLALLCPLRKKKVKTLWFPVVCTMKKNQISTPTTFYWKYFQWSKLKKLDRNMKKLLFKP